MLILHCDPQTSTPTGRRGENSTKETDLGIVPPQHRAGGSGSSPDQHFLGGVPGPRPHGGLGPVVRLSYRRHSSVCVFRAP